MGSVESTVTLTVKVDKGELEEAQKALEKLESYNGKGINLDFKSAASDISKILKDVDSINSKMSNVGKNSGLNKAFNTDNIKKMNDATSDLYSEIQKIGSQKIEAGGMIDTSGILTALQEVQDAWNTIMTAMSTGTSSKGGKSGTKGAENSLSQVNKIMESFSKYSATAQKQMESLSSLSMFKDSGPVKTATEAAEKYQQVITDLQTASEKTGKLDTNMLKSMGYSDERIANLGNEIKGYANDYKAAMEIIKSQSQGLNVNKLLGDIGNGKYQKQIDAYGDKIAKLGDSASKANLTELQQNLQGVYNSMTQSLATGDWSGFISGAQEANSIVQQLQSSLGEVGSGSNVMTSVSSSFNGALTTLNKVVGYGAIYREMRQMAKEMVSTVEEVDTAMNQLQIVTGASGSEMTTFFESSITQAKELGQSVTDVLDTIQVYSRLGYNLEDASELAEYTSILSNVAAVDVEDATTGLTSVIKGFDLDVSEAEHVSDVLIDIGQNYAVSASEILEAFQHSSAAFGATGTTFEEAAAIIAAGNAAVQDASLQTGLKVIEIYPERTPLIARTA